MKRTLLTLAALLCFLSSAHGQMVWPKRLSNLNHQEQEMIMHRMLPGDASSYRDLQKFISEFYFVNAQVYKNGSGVGVYQAKRNSAVPYCNKKDMYWVLLYVNKDKLVTVTSTMRRACRSK